MNADKKTKSVVGFIGVHQRSSAANNF